MNGLSGTSRRRGVWKLRNVNGVSPDTMVGERIEPITPHGRLREQGNQVSTKSRVSRLARAGMALGFTLVLSGIFTGTTQAGSAAQPLFPGLSPRTDGTTVVYQTDRRPG